jgi:hypothetical protein
LAGGELFRVSQRRSLAAPASVPVGRRQPATSRCARPKAGSPIRCRG